MREAVRKSVRFEVFKRDSFTCQYCGEKSPDVVLEVDHITPVAGGGTNDILNLVTACRSCNAGKSDRTLSDSTAIELKRSQLEDLEERRQQLEMLRDWRVSLASLDAQTAEMLWHVWCSIVGVRSEMSDEQRASLVQLLKKYSFNEIVAGMNMACKKHLAPSTTTEPNTGCLAFYAIAKCCRIVRINAEDPVDGRRRYIIGILRNRLSYINTGSAAALISDAIGVGVNVDYVEQLAKQATSWSGFRDTIYDACDVICAQSDEEATDGTHQTA